MSHRFERLFERYKDQTVSSWELRELYELIQSDEFDEVLLNDISNTLYSTTPGSVYTDDPIKDEILERIKADQGFNRPDSSNSTLAALARLARWSFGGGRTFSGGYWLPIAASVILAATTSLWVFYDQQRYASERHYSGKGIFILPDNTQVTTLSADSELTYFTEANSRIVTLRGEAQFLVEQDAARPFFVQTGSRMRTRVLGTSFSVRTQTAQCTVPQRILPALPWTASPAEACFLRERVDPAHSETLAPTALTDPSKSINNPQTIL